LASAGVARGAFPLRDAGGRMTAPGLEVTGWPVGVLPELFPEIELLLVRLACVGFMP
jgi:hypothetical protein